MIIYSDSMDERQCKEEMRPVKSQLVSRASRLSGLIDAKHMASVLVAKDEERNG